MKNILLLFVGLVLAQIAFAQEEDPMLIYRASDTRKFDLIHTQLSVSFDWNKQYLFGEANLTMKPQFFDQGVVSLDAKGMEIHKVSLKNKELEFDYDGKLLNVNLGQIIQRTDTIDLYIKYTAKPNERLTEGSDAIKSDKGLYFINPLGEQKNKPQQIWTQGETESNSVWFPTFDQPNERTTQEISIKVQERFTTLSNGVLISQVADGNGFRTDTWKMDQPHAPYLFMMAIGEYAIVKDTWKDLEVNYYVEKDYEKYAKDIFGNTPEMMTFFSEKLGYEYPWSKYAQVVVRDYVSGAMENTTASIFMEDLQVDKRELKDDHWDGIIAHELMHQWFGDLVTCESWSNLTLNEGFANYSEYLWNEYKYGLDEADYNLLIEHEGYIAEAAEEKKNLIRYYYEDREKMFDSHTYNKGGAVLHMLRSYLGDDAFFSSLNHYLRTNAYQSVEAADLRIAFEDVTGEDLNWFFDQWFFFAGHPKLEITQQYEGQMLTLTIKQKQFDEETPLFRLPVFVDVWDAGDKKSYPLVVEDPVEIYQFEVTQKPDLVVFDSERQLLAEIDHEKSEEELLFQFLHGERLYDRIEAIDSLYKFTNKKVVDQLLTKAMDDPYYIIRQYALEYLAENEIKSKKYQDKAIDLARDPNGAVRAAAIVYLADINMKKYESYVRSGLHDESYLVIGTSINKLIEYGHGIPTVILDKLKPINNINVALTLGAFFIEHRQPDTFDWFVSKIESVNSNALFYFNQVFSQYLLKVGKMEQEKAVELFEQMARNHNNYMVRFSAFQGLMMLTEVKGIDKMLNDIKSEEKDDRLIELYEQY